MFYILSLIFSLVIFFGGGKGILYFSLTGVLISMFSIIFVFEKRGKNISIPVNILNFIVMILSWFILLMFINKPLWTGLKNTIQYILYVIFFIMCYNIIKEEKKLYYVLEFIFLIQLVVLYFQKFQNNYPVGFFPNNPNFSALFVSILTLYFCCILLESIKVKNQFFTKIELFSMAFLVISGLIIITLMPSRISTFATYIAVIYLLLKYKKEKIVILFIALITIFIIISGENFWKYKIKLEDPYAFYRLNIWMSSLKVFFNNFLFGVGLGNFGDYFTMYNFSVTSEPVRYSKLTDFAHSEFLQILCEAGIVGFILLILLLNDIVKCIKNNFKVLFTLIVGLITGMFDIVLHLPANIMLLTIIISSGLNGKDNSGVYFFNKTARKIFVLLSIFLSFICFDIFIAELFAKHANYKTSLFFNSLNPEYYHYYFKNTESIERKIYSINKCIDKNPNNFIYLQDAVILYSSLKPAKIENLINSVRLSEECIERNPFNAVIFHITGKIYMKIKDYKRAREYFYKGYLIEPNFASSLYYVSECSKLLGQRRRSELEFKKARRIENINRDFRKSFFSGYQRYILQ